jgi:hypothetical protein
LTVGTERQIAANRRNARKSTGPRSVSGKKRSSKNAFRHGLSKPLTGAEFARELEALARQTVGDGEDRFAVELARSAAEAELELARVRHLKTELIERIAALRRLGSLETLRSPTDETTRIMREVGRAPFRIKRPKSASGALASIPAETPERTAAEALRRALPELARLARYEIRAAARRDRAIRALIKSECKS